MKTKITVLSISVLLIMSGASVAPALGSISETFVQANPLLIKMILTISSFLIIPSSIISGKMASFIKKRTILIIGLCTYIIGGVGGGFADDIYTLLALRALLGIGVGLILPLSTGLLVDFFEGEEQRKMMGYSTAINNLGAVIAIALSGILASINWRFAFGVYGIALIPLVLVVLFLPEAQKKHCSKEVSTKMNKEVYKLMFFIAVINIVFYSVPTNIAILMKSKGIATTSISGFVIATLNLTSFLVGMNYNKISNYFKKYTAAVSLGSMLLGFVVLSISSNLIQMVISLVFVGLGLGVILPYIFIATSRSVSYENSTYAMALVNSSMYMGQFLSPLFVAYIAGVFSFNSVEFPFQLSGILMLVALVITINNLFRTKTKLCTENAE